MLKNFYTVRAAELGPGDELVVTVKLLVGRYTDPKGHLTYRLYRCAWPADSLGDSGTPQGSACTTNAREIAEALFPVVGMADMRPDPTA